MQKAPSTMETSRTDDLFKEPQQDPHEQRTFGESLARFFGVMFCCMSSYDDEVDETHGSDRKLAISAPTNFRREEMDIPGLTEEQSKTYREKQRRDAERMWNHLQPLRSSPSGTFVERPAEAYPTYEAFTQPRSAPKPGQPRRSPLRVDTTHSPVSPIGGGSPLNTASTQASRADSAYTTTGSNQQQHQAQQPRAAPRPTGRAKTHSRKISESWMPAIRKSSIGANSHLDPASRPYHQPPYSTSRNNDPEDAVEMARLMDYSNNASKTAVNTSATNSPVGEWKLSEESFASSRLTQSTERERVTVRYDSGLSHPQPASPFTG